MSKAIADAPLFLIPIEHLSERGISDSFAARLVAGGVGSDAFRACFDASFSSMWKVCRELARRSPDAHLPPRLTNVVVIERTDHRHPYFRPFEGMSVVVFAADFDPATSSVEHGAYQLLLSERMAQTRRASSAAFAAVAYLMALDDDGAARFIEGAARSTRPDAEGARRVAELLPDLRARAFCDGVGADGASVPPGLTRIRGTCLAIPKDLAPAIQASARRIDGLASELTERYFNDQKARPAGDDVEARLARYLERSAPRVIVASREGEVLWEPGRPGETDRVREAVRGVGDAPMASLIADLEIVSRTTERFFESVEGARSLDVPRDALEEQGGVYLHHRHRLLVYALDQPGISSLREEALPFHRLLLEARSMHEWGHVAADGGVVPVPPARAAEMAEARAALGRVFARVVNGLPASVAADAEAELRTIRDGGARLEDLPLSRIEDYRANLLVRRLCDAAPLEAYVRANVRSLLGEPVAMLRKLARYAYEAQYLWLAGIDDPWRYFVGGTYFLEEYVASGWVTETAARALFDAVGRVCGCYDVDEGRLSRAIRERAPR